MTDPQLNLLGAPTVQPADEQLGSVQRLVVRKLREHGPLARDEIGALMHHHRGKHGFDERCTFCGVDADGLIHALEHRGLVERAGEGHVQLCRQERVQQRTAPDEADVWPAGFGEQPGPFKPSKDAA